jgi:hypothetical protein
VEIAFDAIGFEISNENAFHALAQTVGLRGEASTLTRRNGVLHGRCLKFGAGLEVWALSYESGQGEVVYTECLPAFRARYAQRIAPWTLTGSEKGGAVVHGFIEDANREVLFQLQNLTEIDAAILEQSVLNVGLCGLAYRAGIFPKADEYAWKAYDEAAVNVVEEENYWQIAGHIIAFDTIRNPQTGSDLYWIYVRLGAANLEVLVNQRHLRGGKPTAGAFVEADVWLQGHVIDSIAKRGGYEGVDWSLRPVDFWKSLRKPN